MKAGNGHTAQKNMTEGNITRLLLSFAIPLLISQLLQQLYSMTDAAILGHFAEGLSLAAVGTSSLLLSVILNFFTGFTTGISVLISQYYGNRADQEVRKSIEASLFLCLGVGLFFTIVGFLFGRNFLLYLQTPAEVMDLSLAYLFICCPGITAQMITSAGTSILRALGNTRDPLYILGYTCLLNIVLDLILVCLLHQGICGAAAATVLSQFLSMLLILRKLGRLSEACRPALRSCHPSLALLRALLTLGIPSGLQAVFMSISSLVIQTSINQFGSHAIAGMTVFAKVEGFVYYPLFSLGLALSGFIGQNCGAGMQSRIEQAKKSSLRLSLLFSVVACSLCLIFSTPLLSLFTSQPEILYYGRAAVLWIIPSYLFYGVNQVYMGCLRGCGHTFSPMLVTLICYSFFRIAWCRLLLPVIDSMTVIYTSYSVSLVLMTGLLAICWHLIVPRQKSQNAIPAHRRPGA